MTTQVKPKASGSFTNVSQNASKVSKGDDTAITAIAQTGLQHMAGAAINEWVNCAGTGTHAGRAQKLAAAAGVLLQEI